MADVDEIPCGSALTVSKSVTYDNRNFIRAPDGSIEVIDVPPILKHGISFEDLRSRSDR